MRCPGRPGLRTIPLRRCSGLRPRACATVQSGVAPAVLRLADAMRLCSTCGRVDCVVATVHSRRVDAAAKPLLARSTCLWSPMQAPAGGTDRSRSWVTRHIKRHRFTGTFGGPVNPLPEPGHAPTRSLARCTATRRLEPSRPGWASGPSLCSSSGAHGVLYPSQVCSRRRVTDHFESAAPTCRLVRITRPIDFCRADSTAHRQNESKTVGGFSGMM